MKKDADADHSDHEAAEHDASNDVADVDDVADRCRVSSHGRCRIPSHGVSPFGVVVGKNEKTQWQMRTGHISF